MTPILNHIGDRLVYANDTIKGFKKTLIANTSGNKSEIDTIAETLKVDSNITSDLKQIQIDICWSSIAGEQYSIDNTSDVFDENLLLNINEILSSNKELRKAILSLEKNYGPVVFSFIEDSFKLLGYYAEAVKNSLLSFKELSVQIQEGLYSKQDIVPIRKINYDKVYALIEEIEEKKDKEDIVLQSWALLSFKLAIYDESLTCDDNTLFELSYVFQAVHKLRSEHQPYDFSIVLWQKCAFLILKILRRYKDQNVIHKIHTTQKSLPEISIDSLKNEVLVDGFKNLDVIAERHYTNKNITFSKGEDQIAHFTQLKQKIATKSFTVGDIHHYCKWLKNCEKESCPEEEFKAIKELLAELQTAKYKTPSIKFDELAWDSARLLLINAYQKLSIKKEIALLNSSLTENDFCEKLDDIHKKMLSDRVLSERIIGESALNNFYLYKVYCEHYVDILSNIVDALNNYSQPVSKRFIKMVRDTQEMFSDDFIKYGVSLAKAKKRKLLPAYLPHAECVFSFNGHKVLIDSAYILPSNYEHLETLYNSLKEEFELKKQLIVNIQHQKVSLKNKLDEINVEIEGKIKKSTNESKEILSKETNKLKNELKQDMKESENKMQFGFIQILSFFIAVISFILGSVSVLPSLKSLFSIILFIPAFAASLCLFVVTIIVLFDKEQNKFSKKYIWFYILFVMLLTILLVLIFSFEKISSSTENTSIFINFILKLLPTGNSISHFNPEPTLLITIIPSYLPALRHVTQGMAKYR